jgi:rod shape-determining protein MreB
VPPVWLRAFKESAWPLARSVRVAGNEMDDAVMQYVKRKYNLLIGERTAEAIKMEIGSAYPLDKPLTMEIKGRNLIEGVPKTLTIDDSEIREALGDVGLHKRET